MKNKGFTLLETIVVSLFIGSVLLYLFTQLSNVSNNYDKSFSYNSVNNLYGASSVEKYLREIGFSELKNDVDASALGYIDITDESGTTTGSNVVYSEIMNSISAKTVIITKDDLTDLKDNLENKEFSEDFKKFIESTNNTPEINKYRLFVEFRDNTFATIRVR